MELLPDHHADPAGDGLVEIADIQAGGLLELVQTVGQSVAVDEKLPLPALMRLDRAFGRRVGPLPEGSGYRIRLSARECRNVLDTVLEIVQLITGEQHE